MRAFVSSVSTVRAQVVTLFPCVFSDCPSAFSGVDASDVSSLAGVVQVMFVHLLGCMDAGDVCSLAGVSAGDVCSLAGVDAGDVCSLAGVDAGDVCSLAEVGAGDVCSLAGVDAGDVCPFDDVDAAGPSVCVKGSSINLEQGSEKRSLAP
jgi:hypothetical protein